ncbi:MAG: hypothetical protein GWP39_10050 [Planctomycetia bacterium]|nr:hypothetical protein [Planctomycetia bacterium]
MTGRLLVFSHFFTALFGALLAVFWLGVGEDSERSRWRSDPDQEAQIVELRSRWISEQGLREELEDQLALLRANAISAAKLSGISSAAVAERESLSIEDAEKDSEKVSENNAAPSLQVSFPPLRAGPPDLEEALAEVWFEDAFEAVISRVRSGDIEGAMAQLEKVEAMLRLNDLLPLYETVFDYWVPQWLASSQGSGENWVRLLVEIRERRWLNSEQGFEQDFKQGSLLRALSLDEFLALTVYSAGSLSAEVTQHVVEHLRRCLMRHQGLDSAEIVALATLQSDEVVPLLGEVWHGGKGSKEALMALIQVKNSAAKSLLRSILPEIKDLKLRSAIEIWLSR